MNKYLRHDMSIAVHLQGSWWSWHGSVLPGSGHIFGTVGGEDQCCWYVFLQEGDGQCQMDKNVMCMFWKVL